MSFKGSSKHFVENRPQRIQEQYGWRPLYEDTLVNLGLLATWNINAYFSDVKISYLKFFHNTGADRRIDLNCTIDGVALVLDDELITDATWEWFYIDDNVDELQDTVVQTPMNNYGGQSAHSFSIDSLVHTGGGVGIDNLVLRMRYEQL